MFFEEGKQFVGYFKPFLEKLNSDIDKFIISLAEEVTKSKYVKPTRDCLITLIILLACDPYLDISSKKALNNNDFNAVIKRFKGQPYNPFNKISVNDLLQSVANMTNTLRGLIARHYISEDELAECIFVGAFIDVLTQRTHLSIEGKNDIEFMVVLGRNAINNEQLRELDAELGRTLVEKGVLEKKAAEYYFHTKECKNAMGQVEQLIPENVFAGLKESRIQQKLH